jgi:hypothetical protein
VQRLVDFEPTPRLSDTVGEIVYVDNGIYMSEVPGRAGASRRAAQAALESCGLPIHDVVEECDSIVCLGLQFEGDRVTSCGDLSLALVVWRSARSAPWTLHVCVSLEAPVSLGLPVMLHVLH